MGNTDSAVVQKRMVRFRPDERPAVEGACDRLLGAGKVLSLDAVKASMAGVASASMAERVHRAIRRTNGGAATPPGGASREQLLVFLADVLRGTAEERAPAVAAMAAPAEGAGRGAVAADDVREFLEDLVSAAIQTLTSRGRLRGWRPDRMGDGAGRVKLLAEQLSSELKVTDQGACDIPAVEDWLFRTPAVALHLDLVTSEGLGVRIPSRAPPELLPPCGAAPWAELRTLLDLPLLMFLAPHLPDAGAAPWRLLFSTRVHGESFTRLVSGCARRGPSVLLARDSRGYEFGGFASQSWDAKPQFQGDSRCFLFSARPSLRVYTCTGYNQHYMYLNQGQQTMPNGLGMGGQLGYFGLWLDSDFGRGHSRARPKCTTYGSPQLSGEEEFVLDALEVWGVGQPPESQQAPVKRSVLDADPETQAMMEMAGKTLHSQGLREPEEEES
ncbi:MTOR-associated protein MEAK7 [Megalops cyprinoides]|uniref:MTOR-associated protein MEAK7 n=1 Tax=Megalops cyprinoides TaxID=118141 RepID=UPI0018650129|nr:MTOR-associated protein MEAK7 [Megalops cyprinoides]